MGQYFLDGVDLGAFVFSVARRAARRRTSRKRAGIHRCAQGHFSRADFCQLKPECFREKHLPGSTSEQTAWLFVPVLVRGGAAGGVL